MSMCATRITCLGQMSITIWYDLAESAADYSFASAARPGPGQSALPLPSLRTLPVTHKHKYIRSPPLPPLCDLLTLPPS